MFSFSNTEKDRKKIAQTKRIEQRKARLADTGKIHKDKSGKGLCRIYQQVDKPSRYTGKKLRELRAERGVGQVRRIKKENNNG